MGYAYFQVGVELWGSQGIGECTDHQMENVKSKRRVNILNVNNCPRAFSAPGYPYYSLKGFLEIDGRATTGVALGWGR